MIARRMKSAFLAALALVGLVVQPTLAQVDTTARGMANRALSNECINPASRGANSTWNADNTTLLQGLLDEAAARKVPVCLFATYTTGPLVLPPGVVIEGRAGPALWDAAGTGSGLRLKRGATQAARAAQPALLALDDQTNLTAWHQNGVTLRNFSLYVDKSYNSTFIGLYIGHEGSGATGSFLPRHFTSGIRIYNTGSHGFWLGSYTRDSIFRDGIVYGADGNGIYDAGVDNDLSGWNVGQSLADGWYNVASADRRSNIKVWGSGQYSSAGDTTGFDGSPAANVVIRNALGANISQIYSQEARGYGFRFEGQGVNEIVGLVAKGLYSDGDGAAGNYAGVHMFRVRKSIVEVFVGKQAAGLAGTPYNGVSIATSSGNIVDLVSSGLGSWAFAINSDAYDNYFSNNAMRSGTNVATAASSYTANPYNWSFHEVTTTANTNFVNPGKRDRGLELDFDLIQDPTGGRTYTFGTDFIVPAAFISGLVTTPGAHNRIRWRSDGTKWRPVFFINGG